MDGQKMLSSTQSFSQGGLRHIENYNLFAKDTFISEGQIFHVISLTKHQLQGKEIGFETVILSFLLSLFFTKQKTLIFLINIVRTYLGRPLFSPSNITQALQIGLLEI